MRNAGSDAASGAPSASRREQLLQIAGTLFAERGYADTTVRDIADAAGILSGSLYHHFDSKEAMIDELLDSFQTALFEEYDAILATDDSPRAKLEAVVRASFAAIDQHPAEVAIFQNDSRRLGANPRFAYLAQRNDRFRAMWLGLLRDGVDAGELRADIDVDLVYRFLRDTVWVAVKWYRPNGVLSAREVADQYLAILLTGIADPAEAAQKCTENTSRRRKSATPKGPDRA